jgi:hypothetical protein
MFVKSAASAASIFPSWERRASLFAKRRVSAYCTSEKVAQAAKLALLAARHGVFVFFEPGEARLCLVSRLGRLRYVPRCVTSVGSTKSEQFQRGIARFPTDAD